MKRLKSHTIGVDQGSLVLFSDFEDDGVMWAGNGPREMRKKIRFRGKFGGVPSVQVSLSMWDMDRRTNSRTDISAEKIFKSGFTILFRTWGDTRIARVRADWLAIGELADDDDWKVD